MHRIYLFHIASNKYTHTKQYLQNKTLKILCIFILFLALVLVLLLFPFIYLFIIWLFIFNTVYNLFADRTIVHRPVFSLFSKVCKQMPSFIVRTRTRI